MYIFPSIERYASEVSTKKVLSTTLTLWFVVLFVGQLLFVFYILGFYGAITIDAGLPAWGNTHLPNGYIPEDPIGNIALVGHVLVSVLVHGLGPLQLVPQLRSWSPRFHRWNGRFFLVICIMVSVAGLYMTWAREAGFGGFGGQVTISIVAVLIFISAFQTIRYALQKNYIQHRRWAIRFFLVASAVWFARLIMYGGIFVSKNLGLEFSDVKDFLVPTSQIGQFVIPLAIAQFYFSGDRSRSRTRKAAIAGVVFVSTVFMGVGIYAVMTLAWLPRVGL